MTGVKIVPKFVRNQDCLHAYQLVKANFIHATGKIIA
jgi:hypothetical protein